MLFLDLESPILGTFNYSLNGVLLLPTMLAVAANPMAHANVYLREHFDPAVPGNASDPSRIPVIIAAADLRQKGVKLEETKEPLELILDAVELAIGRSGASDRSAVLKSIDAVACVATWSWPYLDLPASIARRLGKDPDALKRREYTKHAGNQPIRLLDDHAKLIAQGRIQCGLICAGEALKSLEEFRKAGKEPKWEPTTSSKTGAADKAGVEIKSPSARAQSEAMIKHGAYLAIHAYPLYENAVRAARGQKYKANLDESASLYSEFSSIATRIPSSWNYGETPKSAADILEGPTNRMISTPYPLLQNAFNTVNLASAILVCSLSLARDLGIPESKLVYPLGGAGTQDPVDLLARSSFTASPALTTTLSIALSQSRLAPTDIDAWDIYSCFPIVPKLAAMHLGMPVLAPQRKKPVSIIGGLTSFGGAGNSYSMHAVVRMVEGLQKGEWKSGVVLGNGGGRALRGTEQSDFD